MFPILQVGPAAIPVAPIVLLIDVFVSAFIVERDAARLGLDRTTVSIAVYIGLGAALIGARLVYVGEHLAAYVSEPLSMFAPTPATLDPLGGLVVGIGAGVIYRFKYQLPVWRTLDALAPGIATIGLALGIGHLASGDAFGAPARLPWSMYLWDDYRHPSQVYESIAALITLGGWRLFSRARAFDGLSFWGVVALAATSVVVLETFRGDSFLVLGWRVAQVVALGVLAMALAALHVLSLSQTDNISNLAVPT